MVRLGTSSVSQLHRITAIGLVVWYRAGLSDLLSVLNNRAHLNNWVGGTLTTNGCVMIRHNQFHYPREIQRRPRLRLGRAYFSAHAASDDWRSTMWSPRELTTMMGSHGGWVLSGRGTATTGASAMDRQLDFVALAAE